MKKPAFMILLFYFILFQGWLKEQPQAENHLAPQSILPIKNRNNIFGFRKLRKLLLNFVYYDEETLPSIGYVFDTHGNIQGQQKSLQRLWDNNCAVGVVTGDNIDRDLNSLAVFENVKQLTEQGTVIKGQYRKVIPLMGNHELLFLLGSMGDTCSFINWVMNGGFSVLIEDQVSHEVKEMLKQFLGLQPDEDVVEYVRSLVLAGKGKKLSKYIDLLWGHIHFSPPKRASEINRKLIALQDAVQKDPVLNSMANWMKTNLHLYHLDEAGWVSIHGGVPIKNGQPDLSYREHTGLFALAQAEEDMQAAFEENNYNAPVFKQFLMNFDELDASPLWVRDWIDKIPVPPGKSKEEAYEEFVHSMGVAGFYFGHSLVKKTLSVDRGRFVGGDRGMAESYYGQSSAVYVQNGAGVGVYSMMPGPISSESTTLKRAKKARPYARNLLSEMNRTGKTPKETKWTFSNYSAFFTEQELRLMSAMACEDHLDYEKPVKILLDPEQSLRPEELATSITLSLEHYRQHLESIAHPVRGKNSPHEKSLARLQQKVLLSQIYASESVRAFASFFGMNPDSTVNTLKKKLTRLMHLEEAINARLDLLAELLDLRAKITAEGGITLKILGESTNLLDRLGDLLKQNDPQDEIQNQPMILFYMMLFLEKHGLKQNELTGMERLPDEIKKRLIETLLFKMAV